jgi:phage shock protein A
MKMEILKRFRDIMTSNIHAMLDKAEDPEKMIDQYLRDLNSDLGKVKSETAAIMAAEKRERRELDELKKEMDDMQRYAVKALEANNEDDARKFLQRKAELSERVTDKETAVELAATNTQQMRHAQKPQVRKLQEVRVKF